MNDEVLIIWLAVRGVSNNFQNRTELMSTVRQVNELNSLTVLPKFLLRCGGGYVIFKTLKIKEDTESPSWLSGDEMLEVIRNQLVHINKNYCTSCWNVV